MRFLISLFLVAFAATATATEKRPPYPANKFLRELSNQVERAGFRNATIVPHIFLVRVEDEHGKPIMLLVNSDTLQAMILEGESGALTNSVTAKELEILKLR